MHELFTKIDVLRLIIDFIDDAKTLANCDLTCQSLHRAAGPDLYRRYAKLENLLGILDMATSSQMADAVGVYVIYYLLSLKRRYDY